MKKDNLKTNGEILVEELMRRANRKILLARLEKFMFYFFLLMIVILLVIKL